MFTIECLFDPVSGVDAANPFGDIRIADGRSIIPLQTTYLDSWLDALIKGVDQITPKTSFAIVVPEEPEPLRIDVSPNGQVTLCYQNVRVNAPSKEAYEEALRRASGCFLERVSRLNEASQNPAIAAVAEFYRTRRAGADLLRSANKGNESE